MNQRTLPVARCLRRSSDGEFEGIMSETKTVLSIIIVSWNVQDLLKACLQSIYDTAPPGLSYEIFVVDNASHDGSPEMVAREFPDVRLIANDDNKGFGTANNQGLRLCRGRYVLLINPDTIVPAGAIQRMLTFIEEHPRIGLMGPELVGGDGQLPFNWVRCTPRQLTEFLIERLASLGQDQVRILFPEPRQVPILTGACWLVRCEAIVEVGLFDEDLFLYAEEPDVCTRMHDAGWEIWFLRDVQVMHYKRQSTKQDGDAFFVFVELGRFFQSMLTWIKKRWQFKLRI